MADRGRRSSDTVERAVDRLAARAVMAQQAFAAWDEMRLDELLDDIATTLAEHAEHLAAATVAEIGMGNVVDKMQKNRLVCRAVAAALAGRSGIELLHIDATHGMATFASPVGVLVALLPAGDPAAAFVLTRAWVRHVRRHSDSDIVCPMGLAHIKHVVSPMVLTSDQGICM